MYKKMTDALFAIQKPLNNGRGVNCVRSICFYLEQNDWQSAQNTAENEWDKIRSYPDVVVFLKNNNLAPSLSPFS